MSLWEEKIKPYITKRNAGITIGVLALTAGAGYGINELVQREQALFLPQQEIQAGYANPELTDFYFKDLDEDGQDEVIVRYDGKPFLNRLDESGKPVAVPYQIIIQEDWHH